MSDEIKITYTDDGLFYVRPKDYNAAFWNDAPRLNGEYRGMTRGWEFDVMDEPRVRKLLRDTYGTDGTQRKPPEEKPRYLGTHKDFVNACVELLPPEFLSDANAGEHDILHALQHLASHWEKNPPSSI